MLTNLHVFLKKSQGEVSHKSEIISCFSEKHANRILISLHLFSKSLLKAIFWRIVVQFQRDGERPEVALEAPLKYLQICSQLF